MKQIDLDPQAYRVSGRPRIVRSILHKPVFMSISTVLGVWVAITLGVVFQSNGFGRAPDWAWWALFPSLIITPTFLLFAAIFGDDHAVTEVAAPSVATHSNCLPEPAVKQATEIAPPKFEGYRDQQ